jgi:hypothetical protein
MFSIGRRIRASGGDEIVRWRVDLERSGTISPTSSPRLR